MISKYLAYQSLIDEVLEKVNQAKRQHILKEVLDVEEFLLETNQGLLVGDQDFRGLNCRNWQDINLRTTHQQPKSESLDSGENQHDQHSVSGTEVQRSQTGIAQGTDDSGTTSSG